MTFSGNSTSGNATMAVVNESAFINGASIDGSAVTIITGSGTRYGHWHALGIGKS